MEFRDGLPGRAGSGCSLSGRTMAAQITGYQEKVAHKERLQERFISREADGLRKIRLRIFHKVPTNRSSFPCNRAQWLTLPNRWCLVSCLHFIPLLPVRIETQLSGTPNPSDLLPIPLVINQTENHPTEEDCICGTACETFSALSLPLSGTKDLPLNVLALYSPCFNLRHVLLSISWSPCLLRTFFAALVRVQSTDQNVDSKLPIGIKIDIMDPFDDLRRHLAFVETHR